MQMRNGKIITFYSYKGGTGRSMALANVAWLLASAGNRVLAIDWDLEAPGLHRYFEPFLDDRTLENSSGVIDFVLDFATAALTRDSSEASQDWFLAYSNILAHAVPVRWEFSLKGLLHLVPAGRQDAGYGSRVNAFDWPQFYEKLGGGVMLEAMKRTVRAEYDYVLVDSRTGVSDTSGVCTVQMPDEVVVCFTLNRQSISGASGAAASILNQRTTSQGKRSSKIWPIPMRVESAEKDRLDAARVLARTKFATLFDHLAPDVEDLYWGEVEVQYQPYYAYEEVLAVFRDRPRQTHSLLASMETATRYLTNNGEPAPPLDEEQRKKGLNRFSERPATDYLQDMVLLGKEYEAIREKMPSSGQRTYLLTSLVSRAEQLVDSTGAAQVGERLFHQGTDGSRIVGISLARKDPQRGHIEIALDAISRSRSAFEQYHALRLAEQVYPLLDPTARDRLSAAIKGQIGAYINTENQDRWAIAQDILRNLEKTAPATVWKLEPTRIAQLIGTIEHSLLEVRPATPTCTYADVEEQHGLFVRTRGQHYVSLPRAYRVSEFLVTNRLYAEFVAAGGYEREDYWEAPKNRLRLFTQDGKTLGPASWPGSNVIPTGKLGHPVNGISFAEAQAFLRWCESTSSPVTPGWRWALISEDIWEYTARTDAGLAYPWGDAFDGSLCNSAESGIGDTTEVTRFKTGASAFGCCDMAGNLWEFVETTDMPGNMCVLRGGSYKNNRYECRSYLRLVRVPKLHRPLDFGFRLAQVELMGRTLMR